MTLTAPEIPLLSQTHQDRIEALANAEFIDGINVTELEAELNAIRDDVLASLGAADANYIRRVIKLQRGLDLAGRAALLAGTQIDFEGYYYDFNRELRSVNTNNTAFEP